jgi:hypothetical protein
MIDRPLTLMSLTHRICSSLISDLCSEGISRQYMSVSMVTKMERSDGYMGQGWVA